MVRYKPRGIQNNVESKLYTDISSLSTTIQLEEWEWAKRWNVLPLLATLENYDSMWKCMKREIVKVTEINWDVLTVVRKYADCLANDEAKQQWMVSFSFSAGDKISLYITKEIILQAHSAIIDLYENGNDRVFCKSTWWLGIEITSGNVRVGSEEFFYEWGTATLNNNATNYIMLDWAWVIEIRTDWRDQQKVKIATATTSNWNIVDLKQRRMDAIWWVLGGAAWFKNISNTIYSNWNLIQFIADWEEFNLTYEQWKLKTIQSWEKTYTATTM